MSEPDRLARQPCSLSPTLTQSLVLTLGCSWAEAGADDHCCHKGGQSGQVAAAGLLWGRSHRVAPAYVLKNTLGGKAWHGHLGTFPCYILLKDEVRVLFNSVGLLRTAGRPSVMRILDLAFRLWRPFLCRDWPESLLLQGVDNGRRPPATGQCAGLGQRPHLRLLLPCP